jgi:hypothetical protein
VIVAGTRAIVAGTRVIRRGVAGTRVIVAGTRVIVAGMKGKFALLLDESRDRIPRAQVVSITALSTPNDNLGRGADGGSQEPQS